MTIMERMMAAMGWQRTQAAREAAPHRHLCRVRRFEYTDREPIEQHSLCGPGLRTGENPIPPGWVIAKDTSHWVDP